MQFIVRLPERVRTLGVASVVAVLLSQGAVGSAQAVPVTYSFSTTGAALGAPSSILTALTGLSVSGSFVYDADVPLAGSTPEMSAYRGFSSLTGTIGAYSFSDETGYVVVQNDTYSPPLPVPTSLDLFLLNADPSLGGSGDYDLSGFSIDGYTLANVRLFWIEALVAGAPDFLSSSDLPTALPSLTGRLALDFVAAPYAPIDGQASPTFQQLTIAFFDGLTVTPTQVPEPETLPLLAIGVIGVLAAARRRRRV